MPFLVWEISLLSKLWPNKSTFYTKPQQQHLRALSGWSWGCVSAIDSKRANDLDC